MPNYRISIEAKTDLARIYWHGRNEFSEAQADRYYQMLIAQIEAIAMHPYHYQPVDHIKPGYRRCVCGADSIYYTVIDNHVDIMRVLGRQDTPI